MPGPDRVVCFDCETGGVDPDRHPMISLAMVAADRDFLPIGEELYVRIQFDEAAAEPEALEVNNYDPELWKETALPRRQAVARAYQFLKRHAAVRMVSKRTGSPYKVARLVGHNAADFDFRFLRGAFEEAGQFLPAAFLVLDTLRLAQWAEHVGAFPRPPENLRLETLCKLLGIELEDAHDAMADTRATLELARCLSGVVTVLDFQEVAHG